MIKTTDRDMKRAAVVRAAGFQVITIKLQCSPRCAFEYADSQEVQSLLADYEARRPLNIPPKNILAAYTDLLGECKSLKVGAI